MRLAKKNKMCGCSYECLVGLYDTCIDSELSLLTNMEFRLKRYKRGCDWE